MHEPLEISYASDGADRVGVIWLQQGDRPVVVLDAGLVPRLEAALNTVAGEGLAGVVIASRAPRSFVAGADLKAIMALDDDGLHAYLEDTARVFGMIAGLPCPTAAAIGGATLGGGLELAMHCDGLIGAPAARPYPVGLPEAGLKICPGWGGTNLLPARMDAGEAIRRTASGRPMKFDEAVEAGLFDVVAGDGDTPLVDTACNWVRSRPTPVRDGAPSRWIGREQTAAAVRTALDDVKGALNEDPGATVADCVGVGLDQGWAEACAAERAHLVRLRHTPAAQATITAFFAKSSKPKAGSGKKK